MATVKEALAAATSITITLDSLAASATAGRASTAVDNTTNLYLDALVQIKAIVGAGTIANSKAALVYAYGAVDGSSPNYTESVTGTDAAFTINNPTNLPLLGVIPIPTQSATYWSKPMSVAAAFGGIMPAKWGIVVVNDSGIAFSTGLSASFSGLTATVA